MKKTIVFIDGENLLHRAVDILVEAKIVHKKTKLTSFDFTYLLQALLGQYTTGKNLEIRYYGTRIKASGLTGTPRQKALEMAETQRRLKRSLEKQGITFIMCGTLQWREGHRCMYCGKQTPVFQEKGVDVQLAVDVVSVASAKCVVVIVSSDSDLLPAIRSARKAGTRVEYVTFDHRVNWALARNTDKTHDIQSSRVIEAYRRSL